MDKATEYEQLVPIKEFDDITRDDLYWTIPAHWRLFATDIKDSTEAIEEGRYRDVNKIGAASITVVREGLEGHEFPFVFGGDGATLVVSPDLTSTVREQLLGLKQLARDNFDLQLRVGEMSVGELTDHGVDLEVARFELTTGRDIALFRGGGVSLADDLLKEDYSRYRVETPSGEAEFNVELTGLSCRWQPIPSQRGEILSIIVQVLRSPTDEVYREVIAELDEILDGGLGQANPVNREVMAYQSVWDCLVDEVRYQSSLFSFSFVGRFLEILLAVAVFKFGLYPFFFDPEEYSQQLRTHSDYRKFDDMLRLIIDCDNEEHEQVERYLAKKHEAGDLAYGIQVADESLMTCYVEDLDQGGHLHFVDGGDGGYARAAQQLKQQLKETA